MDAVSNLSTPVIRVLFARDCRPRQYVVVIEHNLAVVEQADWTIDLGPDGGKHGGEIVFTGTPEQLLATEHSLTGEYLKRSLARG